LIAKTSFAAPNDYPELPVGLVPAIVSDVEYGDTLNVVIAGTPEQVRLIGLDTPDLGECFVNEGQVFTRDVIGELFVLLETDPKMNKDDTNDDGQLLRHVWLPNGQFLALELLQKGYAYNEASTHTYQQQFAQAEKDAKDEQAGLWSTETCNGKR
jgi:endonuclease YncB( thermonuclease family)